MDILLGDGPLQQLVLIILLLIVLFFILATLEFLYTTYFAMTYSKVSILPDTANSSNSMLTINQDPKINGSKTMLVSDNERTGIEFSYSFFLNVSSDTFNNNTTTLKHVFHKGYATPYPLLGPGVFILSDKNTMRIHMNSFNNWANYIDIENIPVDKWFHTTLVYKKSSLEVYINGNLFKKMPFLNGDLPYQNFQNLYIFYRRVIDMGNSNTPAIEKLNIKQINSQMSGSISRLNYFRYALGFSEIQALMNEGPSLTVQNNKQTNKVTPYLQDTWWTTTY